MRTAQKYPSSADMRDVAPTLAHLVSLSFSSVDGKNLLP
jgi:hypothetical protein